ncbi:MAG: hypothetical protein PHQ53_01485 [Candidatus Krumholzibacteria bacterium]|nr:hypothetical protein [Candidatus Krumholzibacteria bacterium]
MRWLGLVSVLVVLFPAAAAAATLRSAAVVTFLPSSAIACDDSSPDDPPVWTAIGAPDETIQLDLEWRLPDGWRYRLPALSRRLDASGRLTASLSDFGVDFAALLASPPVEAPAVLTLTICRE